MFSLELDFSFVFGATKFLLDYLSLLSVTNVQINIEIQSLQPF